MLEENISQNQRIKYPHNKYGQKAEWLALEHQKANISKELSKIENNVKNIKKEDLLVSNEKIKQYHNQQHDQEFQQKQYEGQLMNQKIQEFQNQNQVNHMIKNQIQNYYKGDYENQIQQHNQEQIQRQQQNQIQDISHNKYFNIPFDQQKQRYENDLNLKLNKMQIQKEQYYNGVLMPQMQKQINNDRIIQKNCSEYQQTLLKNELQRKQEIQNINQDLVKYNDQEKNYHQYQKQQQQIEHQNAVQQRLQNLEMQKQFELRQKQERALSQMEYKKYLDQQFQEKNSKAGIEDHMEKSQKQLQKPFLKNFKEQNIQTNQYIPGFQPQVGGMSEKARYQIQSPQNLEKEKQRYQRAANSVHVTQEHSRYVNQKEKLINAWMKPEAQNYQKIDPIVQPHVPSYMQNPYIAKNYQGAAGLSKQNYQQFNSVQIK